MSYFKVNIINTEMIILQKQLICGFSLYFTIILSIIQEKKIWCYYFKKKGFGDAFMFEFIWKLMETLFP